MATQQVSNTVIKIKQSCVSRKTPNDKGNKISDLSVGAQYYVYKSTKTSGKTWYRISEDSAAKPAWVNSKYCKLLDAKQTKKAIKTGLVSSATTQYATATDSSSGTKLKDAATLDKEMEAMVATKRNSLSSAIDGSVRMFGMPHQLTDAADRRISNITQLGTMFTEKFIMNAPVIYLKPGKSNFLPGMSDTEKSNIVNSIINSAKGNSKGSSLTKTLASMDDNDWRYFDFTEDYASYVRTVNVLCRLCAVFTGLNGKSVPWKPNLTYGVYDWSDYTFETLYNDNSATVKVASGVDKTKPETSFFKNVLNVAKSASSKLKTAVSGLLSDENYVRFYVDASVSFSESISNGTSQSMINSYIDSLSSIGQELAFVSGATGINIDEVMEKSTGTIDDAVNNVLKGDGAISNMFKRLTGTGKQVLTGSNFIAPEIWNSSDYSKSYIFAVTLASPYGDIESWYLNIGVPLMHLLALSLPKQDTANTYTAPYLVRAYSPGWFSCDLGVIESISIEKAPSGDAWGANALPLEIRVGISIKELYSSLSIPNNSEFKIFFANTGLLNYLMINCGFDITKQSLDLQVNVFVNIFENTIGDAVKQTTTGIWYNVKEAVRKKFGLWQ